MQISKTLNFAKYFKTFLIRKVNHSSFAISVILKTFVEHSQRYFKIKCNSCFLNHQSKLRFLRVKLLKGKLLGEWAAGGFWVLSSLNESFWDWPLGRSSLARNITTLRSSVTCTSSFPIVQTSTQEPFWLQQCQFG